MHKLGLSHNLSFYLESILYFISLSWKYFVLSLSLSLFPSLENILYFLSLSHSHYISLSLILTIELILFPITRTLTILPLSLSLYLYTPDHLLSFYFSSSIAPSIPKAHLMCFLTNFTNIPFKFWLRKMVGGGSATIGASSSGRLNKIQQKLKCLQFAQRISS